MPALLRATILAAALGLCATAAQAQSAARPMNILEAMEELSARGLGELYSISPANGHYRVVVRDGAGRLRDMSVDAITGEISPTDTGGLYSNWFDPELLVRLRGTLAPDLPTNARPAHELAAELLRSGDYAELEEIRFVEDAYRARLRDHGGQIAEVAVDPVTGQVTR